MNKESDISLLRKIYEIDFTLRSLGKENRKFKENSYYDKYKDKNIGDEEITILLLEIEVAKIGIVTLTKKSHETERDINILESIERIIRNRDKRQEEFKVEDIKSFRRTITLMEIKYGIPVRLYAGLDDIYNDFLSKAISENHRKRKHKTEVLEEVFQYLIRRKKDLDILLEVNQPIYILKEAMSFPDKINPEDLKKIFDESITEGQKFKRAMQFIGSYEKYNQESQIISSRKFLELILSSKAEQLEKLLNENEQKRDLIEKDRNTVANDLHIIEKVTNHEDLSLDDIESIKKLIETYGVTNETIDFFIKVAQDKISKDDDSIQQESRESGLKFYLEESVFDKVESEKEQEKYLKQRRLNYRKILKDRINAQAKIMPKIDKSKRQEFIRDLDILKKCNYCADELPELTGKIRYIFKDYIRRLESMSEDNFELLLYTTTIENGLDIADENLFYETLCINILKSLKEKDFGKIEELVYTYIDSRYLSIYDFFYLSEMYNATNILENAKKYFIPDVNYYNIFKKIYELLTEYGLDLDTALKAVDITMQEYLSFSIMYLYEWALNCAKKANYIGDEKQKMLFVFKRLSETINELEKLKQQEKENINNVIYVEENTHDNYIVFLDTDSIISDISKIEKEHPNISYDKIIQSLNSIISKDPDFLSRCMNVRMFGGRQNPYGIQELRSGQIKLGFKQVNGANINGKPVYIILALSYGNADLKKSVTLFEDNIAKYARISNAFTKENNSENISDEAEEFIQETREFLKLLEKKVSIDDVDDKGEKKI